MSIKENIIPEDTDCPKQYILNSVESEVGLLCIDTVLPNGAVYSWGYGDEDAVMDYWDEQDEEE